MSDIKSPMGDTALPNKGGKMKHYPQPSLSGGSQSIKSPGTSGALPNKGTAKIK